MTTPAISSRRIIRLPEVQRLVGLGKTKIYAEMKSGAFPRAVKLGRMSGWVESEIDDWIGAQMSARTDGKP